MLAGPVPARSADIEVAISKRLFDRFLKAAAPMETAFELTEGVPAGVLTFSEPEVVFTDGRAFLEMNYRAHTPLLTLRNAAFSGRLRPELIVVYRPELMALEVRPHNLTVKLGGRFEVDLAPLFDAAIVPLIPPEPIEVGQKRIITRVDNVELVITPDGVDFSADYAFAPLAE
jgi:hypothetical protein